MHVAAFQDHCHTARDVMETARRVRENRKRFYGLNNHRTRKTITPLATPIEPQITAEKTSDWWPVVARFQEIPVFWKRINAPLNKVDVIIKAVCLHTKVSKAEIISTRHNIEIVRVRHVAMILARLLTAASFPEIGRRFGGRDHSTIIHATKKCKVLMDDLAGRKEMPLDELVQYAFAQYDAMKHRFLKRTEKYSVSKAVEINGAEIQNAGD